MVGAWIDRVIFATIGVSGLIASALFLLASSLVTDDADLQTTLQVLGFFGVTVTAVIQMRVVAQVLRRESGQTATRRV